MNEAAWMEAAAVAWTCQQLGVPFVALKSVTDIVDGEHATRDEFERNLGIAAARLQGPPAPPESAMTRSREGTACPQREV